MSPKWSFVMDRVHRMRLLRQLEMQRAFCGLEVDIHSMQTPLLIYIAENPGCTQVSIAEALRVSSAAVAQSTKRLAQIGMLDKNIDESNLRLRRIFATQKGIEAARRSKDIYDMMDENMMRDIPAEDIDVFCSVLDRMIENMSGDGINGLSNFELREKICEKEKKCQ